MNERTVDDFDKYAKDYRTIHSRNIRISGADSFYFAELKVKLLHQFEQNGSLNILDIGCGDGATETFFQQHFPLWKIFGIDVSTYSIQEAVAKQLPNSIFKIYDGINIPAADNSFDIVFMAGVLHHIDFSFHLQLIKEIKRVLAVGGRLYIFEHNPLNPFTKYLVRTCVFDKNARLLSCGYTKKLLKQSNFSISQRQFIIFYPIKWIFKKLLWTEKYLRNIPLGGQYFFRAIKN